MLVKPPNSWREVSVRVSVLGGWMGAHGHLPSPGDHQGGRCVVKATSCAFRGFCSPTQHPRAVVIPEWGTVGKHCLTPRIGLVELPCPRRKLSMEAGEGEDPVTYFTYSYCLTDQSRALLICHQWMTVFYIEQQLLIYIYKNCWFYLCPDVWKRKQLSPTSLRGY